MGLPGFFAWILKRFAREILHNNLDKKVKYLYIDANCLFHPECFKILEGYQNDELKELKKKMFQRIINFLDFLEKYVSPTGMMYIAVDGTAPMAKIIQQRKRRYKSELDNFMKNEIKLKYGMQISNEWSNTSITPGTEFMEDLNQCLLKHYENKKGKIKYIYSSYHTPGEGEHKILQHIKKNTEIDDNIVIYGLDADLIFLAMASNRPNIYLLREQTLFQQKTKHKPPYGNNKNKNNKNNDNDNKSKENKEEIKEIEETPFDYINDVNREMTFVSIKETKIAYNKEIRNMIGKNMNQRLDQIDFSNDLIFICFLLGNDFLPHFPSIDIHQEGLDELIDSYLKNLLILNYPLVSTKVDEFGETQDVNINMQLFQMMIEDMGHKEEDYFYHKLYTSTERHRRKRCFEEDPYKQELWYMDNLKHKMIDDKMQLGIDDKEVWKYRYYEHHFKLTGPQEEFIDQLSLMYLNGIKWTAQYYFLECPDWKWNYMCHYAPFISDMSRYIKKHNFDLNKIVITKNGHIPMMSQLVSVLPPSCKHYLPESYRELVTSFDSPIIDMFPSKVQLDMLYKYQLYQCVPLIPYLDIDRVLDVTKNKKLTHQEEKRCKICDDFEF